MRLIDREMVWEAYADNLDYVLHHVERFVNELPGRSVNKSDHGTTSESASGRCRFSSMDTRLVCDTLRTMGVRGGGL